MLHFTVMYHCPHCRQILYHLSHQGSQEYWSGQPILPPGDIPDPGIKTAHGNLPGSGIEPASPALGGRFLSTVPLGKSLM